MSAKTPIRTVFDGSNATGLAEFQSGEFIALSHGGLGASLSIGSAGQVLKVNSGASALEFGTVEAVFNIDNMTDGSGITIADGDDFAISDAGTEKKVNASQIKTYVSDLTLSTAAQTNITSVGTLTALTVDNVVIDGAVIGHTSDTDLITLASGVVTVAGEVDATSLDVSGDIDVDGTANLDVVDIDGAVDLASTLTMASGQELRFVDTNESIKSDGSKLIIKSGGTTFNLPTADGSANQAIVTNGSGTLSFADTASAGFVNSTITAAPGSSGDFDLTKANNTGSSETPFQSHTNGFDVVSKHLFDLMEPKGTDTSNNTDFGSGEAHVGA